MYFSSFFVSLEKLFGNSLYCTLFMLHYECLGMFHEAVIVTLKNRLVSLYLNLGLSSPWSFKYFGNCTPDSYVEISLSLCVFCCGIVLMRSYLIFLTSDPYEGQMLEFLFFFVPLLIVYRV